ncbi:hypothetical protein [Chryseobacterium fistulae]|uniref:Uncharacterized protein n=1 Tax=Chryseobacterium fistulae TaxID=2675058 RepID=A0A6N4XRB2_9FLAO|nr:hypothetical protein [Chryseobacterium fistulae]CAA7387185.1 hypothetical protein CHRY9393_01493 [Chryseobacterium fistulae]
MNKLTILGNTHPIIGQKEMYSIVSLTHTGLGLSHKPFGELIRTPKREWDVMIQTKTGWRKANNNKEGDRVPYTFGQKSLKYKGIKIVVRQGEDYGELIVHPQRAKEQRISKVELLDVNCQKIPKGKKISYKDTIIARAYCIEMFNMPISFTLWEDDANGEGHNPMINGLNRINLIPVFDTVNEDGIAQVSFRLPEYTLAVQIANARTGLGDKDEGATHEYYVTADAVESHIQKASANVNVINPTYTPLPTRKREMPKVQISPVIKPEITPVKPKPELDSPKFAITPGGKNREDLEGKILGVEFVDEGGNKLHSSRVGTLVFLKILAKDMKNKKVKIKIWEEDNLTWTHDLIFEKDLVLVGDTNFTWAHLTKKMFDKAKDGDTDSSRQDYFIEVIYRETSVKSAVIPVTLDAPQTPVPKTKTAAVAKQPQQVTTCICKEQYKDLVWGGKVSCEFRKKVVEVARNLGLPQQNYEGANWLMTIMALETAYTFSPKAGTFGKKPDESSKYKYIGLIQFGKAAAYEIGVTRTHLMSLSAEEQLDYVEKHFKKKQFKNLLNNRTALYLSVNYPNSTIHASEKEYVVYDSSKNAYDDNPMFKREFHEFWIDKKGKKNYYKGREGKAYVWEFEEALKEVEDLGKLNKAQNFICRVNKGQNEKNNTKDIITYNIFSGGKIEKLVPKIIKGGYEKKYKYVFHDKNGNVHELGIFNFKLTKEINPGNVEGLKNIELIDIREFKGYNSNGVKLKFLTLNTDSERYYINPDCYAGLLGAMADKNINYLGFNGFSNYQAKSTGGSSSHRNGEKGDLRYLSKNRKGEPTILQDTHFDIPSQNQFNESLYSFGWGRLDKMYSEHFSYNGKKDYLLNHTKHMIKLGKGGYRHYHHLHLTGFDHSIIKIVYEK